MDTGFCIIPESDYHTRKIHTPHEYITNPEPYLPKWKRRERRKNRASVAGLKRSHRASFSYPFFPVFAPFFTTQNYTLYSIMSFSRKGVEWVVTEQGTFLWQTPTSQRVSGHDDENGRGKFKSVDDSLWIMGEEDTDQDSEEKTSNWKWKEMLFGLLLVLVFYVLPSWYSGDWSSGRSPY